MDEYPKMLYKGEEYAIVADKEEEALFRSDGYAMIGEEPKKRGRKND